ncbi:hypothetical protein OPIT5_29270 [Opitutaceae bacterium TAV5]|nr:hypothetical protein OPIT5_21850 [Opitutaceae bacterium TAV5]AHF93677.1 hypothetical protein OPIT5_29270 [Opitutaceae bacterium TAV5]
MRKTLLKHSAFWLLASVFWLPSSALAQAVPAAQTTAVMVNDAGVVVWPPNFAGANLTPALAGKLDKVTGSGSERAYTVNLVGSQAMLIISTSATTGNLVKRSTEGHILLPATAPTNSIHAASKGYVDARTPQPAFMVCTIQLNTAPGDAYTDFEFKITISNFGEHTPFTDLYLYYHSPDPGRTVVTGQVGPVPSVWFVDSQYTDPRRLRKQSATQSIWTMRTNSNSRIASVMIAVPVDSVIRPDNAALVVEYLRFTPTDHERDAGGRSVWRMVEPSWRTVMPTP